MAATFALAAGPTFGGAQGVSVELQGPTEIELRSATPGFTVRIRGGAPAPFTINLQIANNADFVGPLLIDSLFTTPDTIVPVALSRVLPSQSVVFWRARVVTGAQQLVASASSGARVTPPWLTLLAPASLSGDILDTPTPRFVWRTAPVAPPVGPWRFQLTVFEGTGLPRFSTDPQLRDTTFQLSTANALLTNASYRWRVRAALPTGEAVTVTSPASFLVEEPALPRVTLSYQPFPNPFPDLSSQVTCFWFDVGDGGADVSLDVLDLRGNRVQTVIPSSDGRTRFPQGRYGRAAPGTGTNCSGAYVWNGTDARGETVPAGVYLVRFRANGVSTVRRVLFRGR
ncbi:MAG: hypothetical protein MUF00_03995 [Gemmatimonadaceae bacterium]|nr:hypothetical protein [Gemmatimonadaceae bacterium]